MKTRDIDLEFAATSSEAKSGNSTPVLTYIRTILTRECPFFMGNVALTGERQKSRSG